MYGTFSFSMAHLEPNIEFSNKIMILSSTMQETRPVDNIGNSRNWTIVSIILSVVRHSTQTKDQTGTFVIKNKSGMSKITLDKKKLNFNGTTISYIKSENVSINSLIFSVKLTSNFNWFNKQQNYKYMSLLPQIFWWWGSELTSRWSCRFSPTPGKLTLQSTPTSLRWSEGPIPDNIKSCGEFTAPPLNITCHR